jgi:hypothetical protein
MSSDLKNGAPTMTELVRGIVNDVGDLVRQEIRFARKEIGSDLRKTSAAATYLAIGVGVALVGFILLNFMLVHLLHWASLPADAVGPGLPLWGAFGIVSLVLLVAGGSLAWAGYAKFASFNPMPDKTIQTIQENVSWTTSTDAKTASSR